MGTLVEKELTTPDAYPLSLNALVAGCNQKSNRDPVVDYSEAEVRLMIDGLRPKGWVGAKSSHGARVERYHHCVREVLGLHNREVAVLTELLLRGTQAPGELRTRARRMAPLDSLDELHAALHILTEKGLVREHPPTPGSRATRYGELLSDTGVEPAPTSTTAPTAVPAPNRAATPAAPAPAGPVPATEARILFLEAEVRRLRTQLESLAEKLGEPLE